MTGQGVEPTAMLIAGLKPTRIVVVVLIVVVFVILVERIIGIIVEIVVQWEVGEHFLERVWAKKKVNVVIGADFAEGKIVLAKSR